MSDQDSPGKKDVGCGICFEPIDTGGSAIVCKHNHKFHRECLLYWLGESEQSHCPYCFLDMSHHLDRVRPSVEPSPRSHRYTFPRKLVIVALSIIAITMTALHFSSLPFDLLGCLPRKDAAVSWVSHTESDRIIQREVGVSRVGYRLFQITYYASAMTILMHAYHHTARSPSDTPRFDAWVLVSIVIQTVSCFVLITVSVKILNSPEPQPVDMEVALNWCIQAVASAVLVMSRIDCDAA